MDLKEEKLILLRGIKKLQNKLFDISDNSIEFTKYHQRYMTLVQCLLLLEFQNIGERIQDQ